MALAYAPASLPTPSRRSIAPRAPAIAARGPVACGLPNMRTISSSLQLGRGVGAPSRASCGRTFVRGAEPLQAPQQPPPPSMSEDMKRAIVSFLQKHPIVAFIKGTREAPRCGFSNKVVQILNDAGCDYATVNVLDSEEIRSGMKVMSGWPTFPQVYFEGEFFGGCDILVEAAQSGDLCSQLAKIARNSSKT